MLCLMTRQFKLIVFCAIISHSCFAQSHTSIPAVTIPSSQIHELFSNVVGLTYKLYVKLPVNFDSKKSYDFIFMLDPEYSFAIASNITDHLVQRNDLPEVVVIGIGYAVDNYRINRTRDYTPTHSLVGGYNAETQRHSGGGENFLNFIATELFPYVEKTFGKPKTRTLCGHSYGGLFACWILFQRPGIFERFIIVSPSLWFDESKLLKWIQSHPNEITQIKGRAYFTVGGSEGGMVDDVNQLKSVLSPSKTPDFTYRIETSDSENHNTIFPRAFSNGLRFTFRVR